MAAPHGAGLKAPSIAAEAALVSSTGVPDGTPQIRGYDFNAGIDYPAIFQSYATTGFQVRDLVGWLAGWLANMLRLTCAIDPWRACWYNRARLWRDRLTLSTA